MKGLHLIVNGLLVLISHFAYAQDAFIALTDIKFDDRYDEGRQNPVIKGTILNATENELKQLAVSLTLVRPNEPTQVNNSIRIAADGSFTYILPSVLPYQQIWFSLGDYVYSCLYINEGLNLTFDLERLKKQKVYMLGEGMEFSGKDGEINRVLNTYILYNKKHLPDFYENLYNLKVEDLRFMEKTDSLFMLKRKIDSQFLVENRNIAQHIIESETENQFLSTKIKYLLFHKMEITDITELLAPVYAVTNESGEYLRYLYWYTNNLKLHSKEERRNREILFFKIDSIFPPAFADLVKLQVSSEDVAEQLSINKDMVTGLKTDWAKRYVTEEIIILKTKSAKIQGLLTGTRDNAGASKIGKYLKSTDFNASMYLNEAKTGEELLKSIQASFPDKLIILNLWATWCAPCIQNMPHSKNVQQQVAKENLPVTFVYLCTDGGSSESVWQNKIAELEQPGEHIFVQNEQMNELLTLFNGKGYPTYAVIKPNGQIDTKTINLNRSFDIHVLQKLLKQ
ncbi:TlpA family protein disulfide reductase [Sphingobacterium spiritivorum]|uniref:Thioredoxin domain-containing protein n=1 Tax=Sphingobacterium spiritivorum ATCC 33861 TaxID=525373 RepID=D7VGT4_SPHSI|nr:TlpA disulfide reductase family protein [Sphingobacterium spiritivorum]EFK59286.1 hypothetical protein HMPREF0766_10203 [Sphingobacterium spiritivorum ATCC 33861]QQT34019.1 TlpA family protein disulfide reductase [Sphingobacterium spiritivorum]WQD34844.1 TlpA disulfide reductase family protein [Sphingobacterium spiritivorum]SUI98565.1 thiol-disulfide oxidoreductase [Sphingobacterium spiritivorum]